MANAQLSSVALPVLFAGVGSTLIEGVIGCHGSHGGVTGLSRPHKQGVGRTLRPRQFLSWSNLGPLLDPPSALMETAVLAADSCLSHCHWKEWDEICSTRSVSTTHTVCSKVRVRGSLAQPHSTKLSAQAQADPFWAWPPWVKTASPGKTNFGPQPSSQRRGLACLQNLSRWLTR